MVSVVGEARRVAVRLDEEYVPEHEEDEDKDAEKVLGELEQDQTEAEDVEEELEVGPEAKSDELLRRAAVVEVVRDMLDRRPIESARIAALSDQEREALEFLQAVIDGRTKNGAFLYAERRLEQLNLVLADLQPLLSVGLVEGLEGTLHEVIDRFEHLRHQLEQLEEAQEEVFHAPEEKKKGEGDDDDDKPDDEDAGESEGESDTDAKPKSSLAEESAAAAAQQPKPGTTTDAKPGDAEKKQGLWGRLWNRGKKDEGGGGGGA